MLRAIRLDLLLPSDRQHVLTNYRLALKAAKLLTYDEAAFYYGYTNQSLRHYISTGRLKPVKKGGRRFLTHVEMRRYLAAKKKTGSPRKSQRIQLAIA